MTNLTGTNLNNRNAVGPQGEGRDSPSSFPRYPKYKDSGVEWLGEVPEHWGKHKIAWDVPFSVGWTPPTGKDEFYGGENLWVTISDMSPSG